MPLSNNEQLLWYLFWLFSVVTDVLPNIIICNFNWKLCFLFMFITNANIISIICKCKTTEVLCGSSTPTKTAEVKLPNMQKVALFVTNVSSNGKILFESPFLSMCCLMLTIFFPSATRSFQFWCSKKWNSISICNFNDLTLVQKVCWLLWMTSLVLPVNTRRLLLSHQAQWQLHRRKLF